uniref:Uncharacterized protein n=1 Tax=Kalanchoe fedtschenkoi TaxID=63787 RepID=A0A7N0UXV9_KALFE
MAFQPATPVASPDLVRELLIAISDSLPDNITGVNSLPEELSHPNSVPSVNGRDDGVEKLRSQLISITYPQSPDVDALPVVAARP